MAIAVGAGLAAGVPIEVFTTDPLSQFDAHPLTGFVSNLGVLLWAATAGACLVATLALRGITDPRRNEARHFLVASLALTTLLVLDDLFQLHEDLIPRLLGRGHTVVLIGYVVLVAGYLWRFRRIIAGTEWLLLAAAGLGFALSIGMDLIPVLASLLPGNLGSDIESVAHESIEYLAEDGAKLLGIVLWFTYFVRTSVMFVSRGAGDTLP